MDTQTASSTPTTAYRAFRQSDKGRQSMSLALPRTWYDETGTPGATVPYAEFKHLQDQYNGLKGVSDKNKELLDAANARITTLTGDYEGQLSTARTEAKRATTEAELYKGQHATVAKTASEQAEEIALTRQVLGTKEYAPLVDLLADGLLRVGGMDETARKAYLDKMALKYGAKVQAQANSQVDAIANGITPPGGGNANEGGLQQTPEQMMDKLMEMEPGTPEYTTLSAAYFASIPANKP